MLRSSLKQILIWQSARSVHTLYWVLINFFLCSEGGKIGGEHEPPRPLCSNSCGNWLSRLPFFVLQPPFLHPQSCQQIDTLDC